MVFKLYIVGLLPYCTSTKTDGSIASENDVRANERL